MSGSRIILAVASVFACAGVAPAQPYLDKPIRMNTEHAKWSKVLKAAGIRANQ